MKKIIILFILSLVSFSLFTKQTYAQESSPSSLVKVNKVSTPFDRIMDRINIFLRVTSKSKANYLQEILEKRLSEIEYVFETKQGDMYEPVTNRYQAYAGRLTEKVLKSKDKIDINKLKDRLERHKKVLSNLILTHNLEFGSGFWILVQNDINVINDLVNSI